MNNDQVLNLPFRYVDFIYVLAIRMRQNDFGVTGMHTQLHPLPSDPEKYKAHNIVGGSIP